MASTNENETKPRISIKDRIINEPIGTGSFIVSLLSFLFILILNSKIWASADIRDLISAEADYTYKSNIEGAVSLYAPDAIITDWGDWVGPPHPFNVWRGEKEIRQKYSDHDKYGKFVSLAHTGISIDEVNWISGTAKATSSTNLKWVQKDNNNKDKEINIATVNGDEWEFKKTGKVFFLPWTGQWKISSFTYNSKGSTN